MNDIEIRKKQHIELAKKAESQINKEPFKEVCLDYRALPEINLKDVTTSTTLLGKTLNQPLIIASMTGGTEHAKKINTNLAIAARETQVALGVGSQRIALEMAEARESFELIRKLAPEIVILANMGAIQLNYGKTIEDYQRVVDMIKADALYLHLNALQEAIQPNGDTNFSGILKKVEQLIKQIQIPIFIKEVGHGLDAKTIENLVNIGVSGIDVAGANGTSWAWIESKRKGVDTFSEWFKDFGITIEQSLEYATKYKAKISIIASGGIRNPIQGLKAHILGANYYSAAFPFLAPALEETPDQLINVINTWQQGLKVAMFSCGTIAW